MSAQTGDRDVWITRDTGNADPVFAARARFGAPLAALGVSRTREIAGLAIPFLGRAALVRNKRASGRTKDLADLEALGER